MTANTASDWFKSWGLLIIAGLGGLLFLLLKLVPAPKGKVEILDAARDSAKKLADDKTKALSDLNGKMMENRAELKEIQAIPDQMTRLQALADFANRKKQKS